ncbi:hypothetical protein ColKHC_00009 [Colletotrichum higginsianum]|nr:hypothetical protein ColKHC_00009 [Colletotrichum higginsianum]
MSQDDGRGSGAVWCYAIRSSSTVTSSSLFFWLAGDAWLVPRWGRSRRHLDAAPRWAGKSGNAVFIFGLDSIGTAVPGRVSGRNG